MIEDPQLFTVDNCMFDSNVNDWMQSFVAKSNPEMHEYFPSDYFNASHSQLIYIRGHSDILNIPLSVVISNSIIKN